MTARLEYAPGNVASEQPPSENDFRPFDANRPEFNQIGTPYWFRLDFRNSSMEEINRYLDLNRQRIGTVKVLIQREGQITTRYTTGFLEPVSSRKVKVPDIVIPISLPPLSQGRLYFLASSREDLALSVQLWDPEAFTRMSIANALLVGAALGTLLLLSALGMIVFIIVRESPYLYLALLSAAIFTSQLVNQGYGYLYLWPQYGWINPHLVGPTLMLCMITLLLFTRSYLSVAGFELHTRIRQGLLILSWILATAIGIWPEPVLVYPFMILVAAGLVFMLFGAIKALRQQIAGSLSLLFSMAPLAGSIVVLLLNRTFGLGLAVEKGQWLILGSFVFLSVGLSIALANRVKRLSDAKLIFENGMRTAQQEVQASTDAALLARRESATKSAFLATMSHEIRTPMNGILGMAGLLKSTNVDQQQRYYLETLERSGQTLMGILNDILDYTKAETGRLKLESVPTDLPTLLDDLSVMFQDQMRKKSLDFYVYLQSGVPLCVSTDPTRLKQILANLLSNAIKFTDAGEISLQLEYGENSRLRLTIQDSGIGITPEQQNLLFERFRQADSTISRKYGGTGLGLAICKQLTELMGGTINIVSESGKGTRFDLCFPMPEVNQNPLTFEFKRVVLCSDDSKLFNSISLFLEKYSIHTQLAADRTQLDALNLTSEDVMIVDEDYMSIDDAEYPCRYILLDNESGSSLFRPLHFGELLNQLMAPGPVDEMESLPTPLDSCSILVAEDNPTNRLVVGKLLTNWGAEVRFANNGREALDVYGRSHREIDLVLMDCEMPEMDGYTASRKIRQFESEQHVSCVPIIALTAHALPEFRERAKTVGMTDYITKPIDKALLLSALRSANGHLRH